MKAIVLEKYGSPNHLKLKEIEKPIPKDDEVLIKVHAVSINDWDWQTIHGKPFANRLMFGLFKPKIKILGCDVAGKVEEVGRNTKKFKPGDEVYGDLCECGFGGFAEYVCAKEIALAPKPKTMTFEQAAAIPQAAMLAVQGLIDRGNIKTCKKLLINGAGGGVGTFALQIAKLFQAEVTGVDSSEKFDMMLSLGFDHVIDYKKEDFTKNGQRYDLILDNKISRSAFDFAKSLSSNGMYVTTGGNSAKLLKLVIFAPFISWIYKKKMQLVILKPNKDLAYINELFEASKINPVIDGPHKLAEVPDTFRYFGEGRHKGKVVISI